MPVKIKPGAKITGEKATYEVLKEITEGSMAWSLVAEDVSSGRKVFLKYYKSPTPTVDWYEDYIEYEKELNDRLEKSAAKQYCVLCTDIFQANPAPGSKNKAKYLFQAYDFVDSGMDVRGYLNDEKLDWDKRKGIAKVFLASMKKLHESKVVHCDLKPENIQLVHAPGSGLGLIPRMIDMDRSLLNDKIAPWAQGNDRGGYVGTPNYFSPEHLKKEKPTLASDVFTIGIILCEILCGYHPFSTKVGVSDYETAVLSNKRPTELKFLGLLGESEEKSREYSDLLLKCFALNPGERPTSENLHTELLRLDKIKSHPPTPRSKPSGVPRVPSPVPSPPPSVPNCLILKGNQGNFETRIPLTLGRRSLGKASDEARYAASDQFRVEKRAEGWFICPVTSPLPSALTMVNDNELSSPMLLHEGDSICLKGRVSGNKGLQLTVLFN
jgi:serine/threonine protein kinase